MDTEIKKYNSEHDGTTRVMCDMLAGIISAELVEAESKLWHGHPVWFLDANPIVGYSKQRLGLRLMFWSGADFEEEGLKVRGKKFMDASVFYNSAAEIDDVSLRRWLKKAREIQWDYKNLVKRKGELKRIK